MSEVGFAVVGVRNFADSYLHNIEELEAEGKIKLTAVVVKDQVKNAEKVRELRHKGIEIYSSYENLLKEAKTSVDVIGLPVSIPTHAEIAIKGMKAGFDILLEKPPAPTVQQLDAMIKTEKETGRFTSIGFQFIHSNTIRKIKQFILEGKLGEIKEIAAKGFWPRFKSYYDRNNWAGTSVEMGKLVLDGPMHNAFAHYLNNMIYLAGQDMQSSAQLKRVRAELYRAHSYIESDDNSCLEAETTTGTKIYFYVTHVPEKMRHPYMEIVGTEGKIEWHMEAEETKIELNNGKVIELDNEGLDPHKEVFRIAADKHLGLIENLYCTSKNTRSFVVAINGAYDSAQKIRTIPQELVEEFTNEDGEYQTVLPGIDQLIDQAFAERKLLSDLDLEWAVKTNWVNVENYTEFNPFK
ncbi:putative dehydrogenase [Halanaerobium saccharolyticum]|uniref:Putative dehydrogenase n=1 Tax=Halanaerobium saccharolyticum TaxID=43595 RepID=A0A4V6Q809_9FIRM|nr:Gfo/Idh/MocA family oxidoreductase [Halanaerobium saccharolyticum]RAK05176.1 putative dehydrogenase [Halanaerobium saccharolyticum]TDV99007.1 putative dehydrogenase [Halanaerobium saccharolyticum]TDX51698.1 putative dehydrogenase [Halanaerobium saccharolyticum]